MMTRDHYKEICFGRVLKKTPSTLLCLVKATNAFVFPPLTESLSTWRKNNLRNPQARKYRNGFVTVSVEMSTSDTFGQLVYWEIMWTGLHNRVIDEMLYCTYRVGMYLLRSSRLKICISRILLSLRVFMTKRHYSYLSKYMLWCTRRNNNKKRSYFHFYT